MAFAALEAVQLYGAVSDLRGGATELQASLTQLGTTPGNWTPAGVKAATATRASAQSRLDRANRRLQSDPLLKVLGHLPYARDQVRAVWDLSSAVEEAGVSEGDLLTVAGLYTSRPQGSADPGATLITLLKRASPSLADADGRLTLANQRLGQDSKLQLAAPIRTEIDRAIARITPALITAHDGSQAAQLLPGLLGAVGPKTYLVLLANPSELRPSGGFAGEVGTATFSGGRLTKLELQNEFVVSQQYREKFPPQGQEGNFLLFQNNQLEIGDAGWDPDFPTSAHLQERMYTSATGQKLDGTISIDPYVISSLLKITGPVSVPGYGSFDTNNFFLRTNVIANVDTSPSGGKNALQPIAIAIIAKVFASPSSNWVAIGTAFLDAADQRHLQVSVDNPTPEAILHGQNIDGSIVTTPLTEDYLLIAEANVSATKADNYIQRSVQVKVEIYPSGLNRHEVDIHYDYPPPKDATDDALNRSALNPTSIYRDYVRFYLPLTATLGNIGFEEDGKPAPAYGGGLREQGVEASKQVYGTFFTLPRGHSADLIIYYEVGLPAASPFQLYVQKQAGLPELPIDLEVSYPGGIAKRSSTVARDEIFTINW